MSSRNPVVTFYKTRIKLIGDPHLGRIFKRNVPVAKFGIREKQVFDTFSKQLEEGNSCKYTIIVGDLFDSFRVSNEALSMTYRIITKFLKKAKTTLVIIPGNHDLSKDITKVSSYSILLSMLEPYLGPNLIIVHKKSMVLDLGKGCIYLDAYDPLYKTHTDRERPFIEGIDKPILSVGHWDDPRFGEGYLPSKYLLERTEKLYSGHIHVPDTFLWEGIEWSYTGSMEPYGHAEDPDKLLYASYDYTVMERLMKSDIKLREHGIADKNIRIDCYPGYFLPMNLDCMSLTYNPILPYPEAEEKEVEENPLDLSDFNTMYLYTLREEFDLDDELLINVNNFLKDDSIEEFKL